MHQRGLRHSSIGLVLAAVITLLGACSGGQQAMHYEFSRPIDADLIGVGRAPAAGQQPPFDLSHLFGGVALGGEIAVLTVDDRIGLVVIEADDERTVITVTLPEPGPIFLRLSDRLIAEDSCPVAGSTASDGVASLNAIDAFDHPIRRVIVPPRNFADLDATDPALTLGQRYYVQACVIDPATSLFTGDGTNVVVIEIASALPDLVISEIRLLGRSADALGRPFIRVTDRNAAMEREVRGDSFNYQLTIRDGGDMVVGRGAGSVDLQASGGAWIIPGTETPADPSDDIRLADDGLPYRIVVSINDSSTGITFPESNHDNNRSTATLSTRPKPLVLGFDRIDVRENCDGVSPGDWLMMLQIEYRPRGGSMQQHRFISNGTTDVDDHTVYTPKQGFRLIGTDTRTAVAARIGFVDCDIDALTGFLLPAGPFWSTGAIETSCGGEEAYEVGGIDDLVGWADVTLSGVTAASPATRLATASEEDCGPNPYVVEFKLMTPEQAVTEGYTPDRILRIP